MPTRLHEPRQPERIVAAGLQLSAAPASSLAVARAALLPVLRQAYARGARLAVLPAYSGLALLPAFARPAPVSWQALAGLLPALAGPLGRAWLALSAELARESRLLLLAGTTLMLDADGLLRHRALLLEPDGSLLGWQDQTHPGPREQALGVVPSDTLAPLDTTLGKLGVVVGDDVWLPEVGAILAQQGAAVLLHPAASASGAGSAWHAGLWRETQAHQLFGVDAPLIGLLCGTRFAGLAAIYAPCQLAEPAPGRLPGLLAQAAAAETEALALATLELQQRQALLARCNLTVLRNNRFYRGAMPACYPGDQA